MGHPQSSARIEGEVHRLLDIRLGGYKLDREAFGQPELPQFLRR
jgi:hypothetical protein